MKKYLIPNEGKFYKANLHSHSTISDGANTPEEMKDYYKAHGYQILAITDHELLVDHSDLNEDDFLMVTGYEYGICEHGLDGFKYQVYIKTKTIELNLYPKDPHNEKHVLFHPKYVVHGQAYRAETAQCYGEHVEREYSLEFVQKLVDEAKKNGFLVYLNHPTLSFTDWEIYKQIRGLCGMEIHNQDGYYNFCEYNAQLYDTLSRSGMHLSCTASDDNHRAYIYDDEKDKRPWGFTMIKAKALTHAAVWEAMEKGDMYASQGPLIHELYMEDSKAHIAFSNAKVVIMKTDTRNASFREAAAGEYITQAVFGVPKGTKYVRFTVIDEFGRNADTRAYYLDE